MEFLTKHVESEEMETMKMMSVAELQHWIGTLSLNQVIESGNEGSVCGAKTAIENGKDERSDEVHNTLSTWKLHEVREDIQ